MQVQDITVEIRNAALERIGQFTPDDLIGFVMVMRYNNVGSWSMTIPANSRYADVMRQPGTGIIVSYAGEVIYSGSMTSARLQQSIDNLVGDWVIEGADDSLVLTERLAYPVPSTDNLAEQIDPYDLRTGVAETVIKGYVADNIGNTAGTSRAIANFIIEADELRGYEVSGSARFQSLQELIYPLAQTGGIGYNVEQNGDVLEFKVYEPIDRSASVRMDLYNGRLTSTEYAYVVPELTRAIVGGDGDGAYRALLEGTSAESLDAELIWGRKIERFVDGRGTTDSDELTQSANSALVDKGKTIVNLNVVPSDNQTMRFGYDWNLGDKVTVVAGDIESSAVVTEVGISVQSDGVRLGATVGTPTPISFESKIAASQQDADIRISNLERNAVGAGISVQYQPLGGTNGTQPTFSGPVIFGSFTRTGRLIHFQIDVDFDNITDFGTGHYYLTLPYAPNHSYQFREGCLHDQSTGYQYQISGHVAAGSTTLWLFSSYVQGNKTRDLEFTSIDPVTLVTADNFHIAGTYEIEG